MSTSTPRQRARKPTPQRPMLNRGRLLDVMAARFDRVATLVTAGAGFGKTTLVEQVVAEPSTASRVRYVLHRVLPNDLAGDDMTLSLATQIAAIAATDDGAPHRADVSLADQLWHLSPRYVTVVIDDIHLIASGSPCWIVLNDLLLNLPDNADMILCGRGFHELTLARLIARGEVVEIDEAVLAFTDDELDAFARLREVPRNALADHGWPALTELEACAGVAGARDFVAQEVLDNLPSPRVAALRLVAPHAVIDDELVHSVTEFDGTARDLLVGLPLVSEPVEGSWTLHDLWREVLIASLTDEQRRRSLVIGAERFRRAGRLRAAIAETVAAQDDDATLDILVEFARDLQFIQSINDRRAVLEILPASLATTAEAELLRADIAFATEPMRAAGPLQRAIDTATGQNRPEVTVLALLRLGDMAYRSGDRAGLLEARRRLDRLHQLGGTGAGAALVLAESWLLLLDNAAESAIALMNDPVLRSYRPVASMVRYYRAVQLGHAGRAAASLDALDEMRDTEDARILERRGGFESLMKWWTGTLDDDERARSIEILDQLGDDRQHHLFVEGAATAALFCASAGDLPAARRLLDRAIAQRDRVPDTAWGSITVELATAVIELMDGHEESAAARLDRVLPADGPFDGFARHVFGNVGTTLYALVPRARRFFDDEHTGADLALATEIGAALVALRERRSCAPAAQLPWLELGRLRTWAYEPHLAELAIAAMHAGNQSAGRALASLVHDPRGALRRVAERHRDLLAELVESELARTPRRPSHVTYLNVLGPTALGTGAPPDDTTPPIKRKMVRELLLLLVHRRRIRREEVAALLWPDKDDDASRNNLRATLSHLRSLLEHQPIDESSDAPADDAAPPWHVRSDGDVIELHSSDRLVIDVEEFRRAVAVARRADQDRLAGPTLIACREAIASYGGPYLDDAFDLDYAANQRLAYHLDFVDVCTRASELCQSRSEALADAVEFARKAVDAEPLSERAHRALIRAIHSNGDAIGALRAYERAIRVLEDDGLSPDPETLRLGASL